MRKEIEVKFALVLPEATLPVMSHDDDAAFDFYTTEEVTINPGERKAVTTGVAWLSPKAPAGKKFVLIVKSRSGLAFNSDIEASNAGVIDQGYTGVIKVMIQNFGNKPFIIKKKERFAQGILFELPKIKIKEGTKEELDLKTNSKGRGSSGFGSTGKE